MANRRTGAVPRSAGAGCVALLVSAVIAATAVARNTPKPSTPPARANATPTQGPVTDANVAARVLAARNKADERALAAYYKAKAAGEDERIAHFEQLLRAYMKLEGKQ